LRNWKQSVVNKLTGGLGQLSQLRKITYIQGRARFTEPTKIKISPIKGSKYSLKFDYAVLATGSRPATIPGLIIDSPQVMNSTAALDLKDIPRTLLVIGGGYIGLEMGSVYASLGSEVTVVEMMPSLLPGVDKDLVKILHKSLENKFKSILLETKVSKMKDVKSTIKVEYESKAEKVNEGRFEKVLYSIGRKPNTEDLGLEDLNIELDSKGFIKVDPQRKTSLPTIFAIGDVTGEPMLAHKATHEGRVAVEVIAGHKAAFEPRAIPAVVFTDPEVAWCGLTESEAEAQYRKIEVTRFPWAASGRALTMGRADGLTKLIIDPDTERVLGMGVVGAGAGELIAEGVLAIEMAALATDVKLSIHPHPTLSETIMESAEVFFGQSTHIYRPKRK
jgi:dihydrolipoamide dehydrogenase